MKVKKISAIIGSMLLSSTALMSQSVVAAQTSSLDVKDIAPKTTVCGRKGYICREWRARAEYLESVARYVDSQRKAAESTVEQTKRELTAIEIEQQQLNHAFTKLQSELLSSELSNTELTSSISELNDSVARLQKSEAGSQAQKQQLTQLVAELQNARAALDANVVALEVENERLQAEFDGSSQNVFDIEFARRNNGCVVEFDTVSGQYTHEALTVKNHKLKCLNINDFKSYLERHNIVHADHDYSTLTDQYLEKIRYLFLGGVTLAKMDNRNYTSRDRFQLITNDFHRNTITTTVSLYLQHYHEAEKQYTENGPHQYETSHIFEAPIFARYLPTPSHPSLTVDYNEITFQRLNDNFKTIDNPYQYPAELVDVTKMLINMIHEFSAEDYQSIN